MNGLGLSLAGIFRDAIAIVAVFMVSIIIHEFGHFIVAKKSGVAVPAFAIGFGPKLLKWKRHGTEFSLRLFLIGGLVQLAGEIPQNGLFKKGEEIAVHLNENRQIDMIGDAEDVPNGLVGTLQDFDLNEKMMMSIETDEGIQTFPVKPHARLMTNARNSIPLVEKHEQVLGKPLWQRAAIILAGPFMNFVLAGALFTAFFWHSGIPVPVEKPVLGAIMASSPAQHAGLQKGDTVLAVDGKKVTDWTGLVQQIRADKGKPPGPIDLTIQRKGQVRQITVNPEVSQSGYPMLGVNEPVVYNHNKLTAITHGFSSVYYGSVNALQAYGKVIFHHQYKDLSGPVGIASVVSQQAQYGIWHIVMITGLLSLNLGLFNLLPIPALDGGRLLFMVVEAVRGKAVDPNKEGFVHLIGFALLMLFAVVITYRDVTRLF